MTLGDKEFTAKKDRKKVVRTVLQAVILLLIIAIGLRTIFVMDEYKPYDRSSTKISDDKGFIAISYFGVDRIGNNTLIGSELLEEHLDALKRQGYVTITQQDIENFYRRGKPLPEKSLFLMFEDGRRDTAIFAQGPMVKDNFKATMFSYADKFEKEDTKFLRPDELTDLQESSFWELGTNGYRLYYINVFDRYDGYLGDMDTLTYSMMAPVLGRKYNHYLMDFIRDKDYFPKESYTAMRNRISTDYTMMRDVYTEKLGFLPGAYVLMHANTNQFGNNRKVSDINGYWISRLFKMNFNREGFCLNERSSSIYDLTRMQPQSYWPVNHLLMRIKYDTGDSIEFKRGDAERLADWEVAEGAAEIKNQGIILTSIPRDEGRMILRRGLEEHDNFKFSVRLHGNVFGTQKIYLYGANQGENVSLTLKNNRLLLEEAGGSAEDRLLDLDLDEFDGVKKRSIEEDKKYVVEQELGALSRYARTRELAQINLERLKDKKLENPPGIADGAEPYEPVISYHRRGQRDLVLEYRGGRLIAELDGRQVCDAEIKIRAAARLALASKWGGDGYNQRNLADDVYDAVFERISLTTERDGKTETLYDLKYEGWDQFVFEAKRLYQKILAFALGDSWAINPMKL